jgi:histidine kinase
MKLLATIRRRLGWKLFFSYLIIIVVGALVMVGTAEILGDSALARHIARMEAELGDDPGLVDDLHENFHSAVNEILAVATGFAVVAAVAVSTFTTRRIVDPIRSMLNASRRIADGDYHERIQVASQDELGTLAEAFNRMAAVLEQTEERRLELIGDVAHELRTPLSSIRGTMEGLVDGVLVAEPATFLGVQREVSRLQRLVHDLDELSRAEAGQIAVDPDPLSPAELVEAAIERLGPQFEDKEVALRVGIPTDLPRVWADASRITQVLLNLLGNALQYTPTGGQVTIRARQESEEVLIEVQDTGSGIPAEHLPHIFERFYRVDKSRSRAGGGTGIGLTIVKHLVEAHGGRIWATSPGPDQGATFSFTLPLAT